MAVLSFDQIVQVEERHGATAEQAQIGAGIVEAESGGDTQAHGDLSFGQGGGQYVGSLGMWQIFGQAHPSVSAGCAEDPECSTEAARQISDNWTNWHPWTTFNTGAYRRFLGGAPDAGAPLGFSAVPTPQSAFQNVLDKLFPKVGLPNVRSIEPQLKDFTWRSGFVILGLVLLVVGIGILFQPTLAEAPEKGAQAIGTATKLATVIPK